MKKIIIILILLALSCGGPMQGGRSIPDGLVSFQVILAGPYSQAKNYNVQLVTNKSEWENVWLMARGREEPLPPIPTVNFNRQYVVAAFMGERPSSGYKIEITSIIKQGQVLKAHVKKFETPGMLTVITNPFVLVRVPKGNYRLEVVEETVR
jgi:hypothetical protein